MALVEARHSTLPLGSLDVSRDIIFWLVESPLSRRWFEVVPENIRKDGVQTHGFGLPQSITPVLWRYTLGVHLSADDLVWLAMEEDGGSVVCEGW